METYSAGNAILVKAIFWWQQRDFAAYLSPLNPLGLNVIPPLLPSAGRYCDGLHGGRVADGNAGNDGGLHGVVHRVRLQGDLEGAGVHAPPVSVAPRHKERQRAGELRN